MLLAFRPESLDKIRREMKRTTVRRNADYWWNWSVRRLREGRRRIVQIYDGNPRNGGRFVCETWVVMVLSVVGKFFTRLDAESGGFDTLEELKTRLAALHGLTLGEVDAHRWALIAFDPSPVAKSWKNGSERSRQLSGTDAIDGSEHLLEGFPQRSKNTLVP